VKAEQSSIYRHLELLHLWCMDTFENSPKQPVIREDVRLLVSSIVQAQTATAIALNAEILKQRLDLIDVVLMNMTNVKSITKVITEYSSKSGNGIRVITKKQRVALLDIMTTIGVELGKWRNKTISRIKDEEIKP